MKSHFIFNRIIYLQLYIYIMTQTIEELEKLIRNPNWKKIYLDSRYPPGDEFKKTYEK